MVIYRQVSIYAPFIICFLNFVLTVHRPREPLSSQDNLVVHVIKQLKKKKHVELRIPVDHVEDVFATSTDNDFELEAGAKPSWVTKLTDKVKKTFCMQSHIQNKLYETHVNAKMVRRRYIPIMRTLNLHVGSGCEKHITPEGHWIYEHST